MTTGTDVRVLQQLQQVQESGRTNMLDRNNVQAVASSLRGHALVVWISEHTRTEYGALLMGEFSAYLETPAADERPWEADA